MKQLIYCAALMCAVLLVCLNSSVTYALPRFALRGGDVNCRGCHFDPTGGRIRTEGGDNFAAKRLEMWPDSSHFSGNIGESIRMGVDLRTQYLYFSTHTTADFTLSKTDSGHTTTSSIHHDTTTKLHGGLAMAFPVYFSANLTKAVGALVKLEPITNSWEGYAIAHVVHSSGEFWDAGDVIGDAYIKVGAFYPAFGIRFDDHTIYTRGGNASISRFPSAGLFWQPNYRDGGVEFGMELFDHAFVTADVLNGDELAPGSPFKLNPNEPLAVSLRVVVAAPIVEKVVSAEIGGSLYLHTVQNLPSADNLNDSMASTHLAAIHGGLHVGRVSLLAEADFGTFVNHYSTYNDKVHAFATEGVIEITKGLTGILRFDNFGSEIEDTTSVDVKSRFMVGLQWFPVRFLEVRPEFRIAKLTVPATEGEEQRYNQTETTALLQTHVFF